MVETKVSIESVTAVQSSITYLTTGPLLTQNTQFFVKFPKLQNEHYVQVYVLKFFVF